MRGRHRCSTARASASTTPRRRVRRGRRAERQPRRRAIGDRRPRSRRRARAHPARPVRGRRPPRRSGSQDSRPRHESRDRGRRRRTARSADRPLRARGAAAPPVHLAGGSPGGAALHLARAVCRRAERRMVSLEPPVESTLIRYINRLSDLLFVAARLVNTRAGVAEVEWSNPPSRGTMSMGAAKRRTRPDSNRNTNDFRGGFTRFVFRLQSGLERRPAKRADPSTSRRAHSQLLTWRVVRSSSPCLLLCCEPLSSSSNKYIVFKSSPLLTRVRM